MGVLQIQVSALGPGFLDGAAQLAGRIAAGMQVDVHAIRDQVSQLAFVEHPRATGGRGHTAWSQIEQRSPPRRRGSGARARGHPSGPMSGPAIAQRPAELEGVAFQNKINPTHAGTLGDRAFLVGRQIGIEADGGSRRVIGLRRRNTRRTCRARALVPVPGYHAGMSRSAPTRKRPDRETCRSSTDRRLFELVRHAHQQVITGLLTHKPGHVTLTGYVLRQHHVTPGQLPFLAVTHRDVHLA